MIGLARQDVSRLTFVEGTNSSVIERIPDSKSEFTRYYPP
jgi:hypothetical protein